jgi:GT2 family glycosyltransferase
MSIHVLVLNYNGLELLKECLPSVVEAAKAAPVHCAVSVLDNASSDGSKAWLQQNLPSVRWIQAAENRILLSYNAVVAHEVDEQCVLLLNNDIKVEKDFIRPLWEALLKRPQSFAASPRHLDFGGRYNGGMNRFGLALSLPWAGPAYRDSEAESLKEGVTLFTGNGLFRRDRFLELGGFDSLFAPMGWEDADLCARAWRRNWPTLYIPSSVIYHKSSASIARAFARDERAALGFRNGVLWFLANFSSTPLMLRFWGLLPLTALACALTFRFNQLRGLARAFPRLKQALARRAKDRPFDRMGEKELFVLLGGER